jgi:hypothetical protein
VGPCSLRELDVPLQDWSAIRRATSSRRAASVREQTSRGRQGESIAGQKVRELGVAAPAGFADYPQTR